MASLTPRNSPFSLFSGNPRPEIPRPPFKGGGFRGTFSGGEVLAKACNPEYTTLGTA